MESMTGYARIEGKTGQFSFSVEIKALNSKFQEIYVNVPKVISGEEYEITDTMKKAFTRGKVEMSIDLFDWTVPKGMSVNHETLKRYYDDIIEFKKKSKATESFSLDGLLSLDGVIQKSKSGISTESVKAVKKILDQAIKDTLLMRKTEGKSIEKDLLSSVSSIEGDLAIIAKKSAFSSKDRFEKLKERIEKVSPGIEDPRLYSEVAIYADKIDINEEITRLTDHIKKFRETAKLKDQIGKKLDFIAQEMFREANTIGSKTISSEVSHLCVNVKNNIEKIREQCRNVV